jgi:hypothetical protein
MFIGKYKPILIAVLIFSGLSLYSQNSSIHPSNNSQEKSILIRWKSSGNPVVIHKYTCDPAAMLHKDTLYIFTGQDAAGGQNGYNIKNWYCFATTDMKNFWEYEVPLKSSDFHKITRTV